MKYFRTVVRYGHQGYGRDVLVARYIKARDIVDALDISRLFPGVKHNHPMAVCKCASVSKEEYLAHMPKGDAPFVPQNAGEQYVLDRLDRRHRQAELTKNQGGLYNECV